MPEGGNPAAVENVATRPVPSAESRALSTYYAGIQADLLSQGLLRTDRGEVISGLNARQLAENFTRIALYDEYTLTGERLVAMPTASSLRRWESPVVINVEFGDTVPEAQRRRDLRSIGTYASRLSRITGLPITLGQAGANFHVLILNEDERRTYGPRLRRLVPGVSDSSVRAVEDMPRSTFCLMNAFAGAADTAAFFAAVAVIRAEHPDRMRLSCIHEEIAQGLGLTNDSRAARPSIFNDDEEFALLTGHDELLLRILYDPRLRIGMDESEATPIVRTIAEELMGGS